MLVALALAAASPAAAAPPQSPPPKAQAAVQARLQLLTAGEATAGQWQPREDSRQRERLVILPDGSKQHLRLTEFE